ncbi:MAG: FAD-dependent monooxygenase [Dermatophilaceae bacterium]
MAATREVLIVGGGPTGVVLGMLLGDFGIDVLVVDKRPRISPLPRARGIHARAAEILRQLGIEDDMVAAALPVRPALEVRGPLTEPPVAVVPTGGEGFVEVSPSEGIAIAQDRFESVLRQHLTRRSTVELRPGVGATELSLEEGGSGAVVTLTETASGRTSTVRAEYVVGADGWRSDIRRGLGVPFLGEEHLARLRGVFFRADLRPWLGDPPPAFIQLTHVPGILLSTHPDHRWATMRLTGPDGAGPKVPEALIREHLGVDVPVEVLGDTTFSVGVQWAETLQRGRVLLAGDAAHRVTPQGAGGISAAMADAHNLAWKLAAFLRGWGSPRLLASYAVERGPVTRQICAANKEMWLAMQQSTDGPPRIDLRVLDMGYRYASPVVTGGSARPLDVTATYEQTAAPGARAPHVWLDDAHTRSTIDAFGTSMVLLAAPNTSWLSALPQAAAGTGIPVDALAAERDDVRAAYRLHDGDAVLVRPDGHIAWRSHARPSLSGVLRQALLTATGR